MRDDDDENVFDELTRHVFEDDDEPDDSAEGGKMPARPTDPWLAPVPLPSARQVLELVERRLAGARPELLTEGEELGGAHDDEAR